MSNPHQQKVTAYITHRSRLLLLRHTSFPEAGVQVPSGTMEPGESPETAVLREAFEETGLPGLEIVGLLGQEDADLTPMGLPELHRRYFFHLRCTQDPPASWSHWETHHSRGMGEVDPHSGNDSGDPVEFELSWARLPHEIPWLMTGYGRFLPQLCRSMDLPVGDLEAQADFTPAWDENDTARFLAAARYYVPRRERQIETLNALLPASPPALRILELGCGDGLLLETILEAHPRARATGLDGSWRMLAAARQRLERFGDRVTLQHFQLAAADWRRDVEPYHAIVSSLVIHHLDDDAKRALYKDLFPMLAPGGVLALADVFQPADRRGLAFAARTYDEEVLRRSLELDGNDQAYLQFQHDRWNLFRYPDPSDRPALLLEQLNWLEEAGFSAVDVYWLHAGHAIFGGVRSQA